MIVLWLPIAAFLSLLFQPTLDIAPLDVVVFLVAIWGAYLILRSMLLWLLGHGDVLDDPGRAGVRALLHRRAAAVRPARAAVADARLGAAAGVVLPFQWTFGFPIEALIGELPPEELLGGLVMQVLWIAIGATLVASLAIAIRRFSRSAADGRRSAPARPRAGRRSTTARPAPAAAAVRAVLPGRRAERAPVPGQPRDPALPVGDRAS